MNQISRPGPPPLPNAPAKGAGQRRAFERLNVEVEVDVWSDHNFYTGFSTNISEGGLFVATHVLKPVGTVLEIRFTLPSDPTWIVALADVRWVRTMNERSDAPPGLGMRFVRIDELALRRVSAFIRAREPLFYEE
jgi:uncharacterized protein (TIGR02266 family)